ncbi:MAG TPA: hypothetical protein VMT88_01225 [Actinomycetes bacterium]|nr:hypothetical protein [Actinomycetes bacterium]
MRKFFIAVLLTALSVTLLAQPAMAGGGSVPPNSNAFGNSRATWATEYTQWILGDSSNPLFTPGCGEMVDGAYFMETFLESGAVLNCDVPVGVPIVVSHAGYYAWIPDDGLTDQAIEATAAAAFQTSESTFTLDGRSIPLVTTTLKAFDVISEPGSAYDTVIGLGTGPIRTALVGQVTVLRPLTPGDHTVYATVDFAPAGGPFLDVTYHIHVG